MEYLLDDPTVFVDMLPLTLPAVLDPQVRKLSASLDLRAFAAVSICQNRWFHRLFLTTGWCAATQKRALSEKTAVLWNRQLEMIR